MIDFWVPRPSATGVTRLDVSTLVTWAKACVDSFVALVYTPTASVTGAVTVWRYLIASYPNTMNYCCSLLSHHFVWPTFAATMPDSQHRYISSPSQSDPPASQL